MNRRLAKHLLEAALDVERARRSKALGPNAPKKEAGTNRASSQAYQTNVIFEKPLRGKPPQQRKAKEDANEACVGGA